MVLLHQARDQGRKSQVHHRRYHRVAAGKALCKDLDLMRDQIGPGAVEELLEQERSKQAAAGGGEREDGRAPVALERQEADDGQHRCCQDGVAAKRSDVADGLLEPPRADGIADIGVTEGQNDLLVDGPGLAFMDFVGKRDEAPCGPCRKQNGDEEARSLELPDSHGRTTVRSEIKAIPSDPFPAGSF